MLDIDALNRHALAAALDTDLGHISRICTGHALPSLPLAVRMARHLGVTMDDLCASLGVAPETMRHQDTTSIDSVLS
jgi:plasmid maintenance system antidote protein VapI